MLWNAPSVKFDPAWHALQLALPKNSLRPRSADSDKAVWRSARYLDYTNWEAERMREAQFTLVVNEEDEENVTELRQYIFGLRGGIPVQRPAIAETFDN